MLAEINSLFEFYPMAFLYLIQPIAELPPTIKRNICSMSFFLLVSAACVFQCFRSTKIGAPKERFLWSIVSGSLALSILGAVPYLLGGYRAIYSTTGGSRVFSSFSFGLALLFGGLIEYLHQQRITRAFSYILMFLLPILVVTHISLAKDWQIASSYQRKLWSSTLDCCPDIEDGTAVILLDAQTYAGRSVVADGVPGTKALAQIMYSNPSVSAYLSYSKEKGRSLKEYPPERITVVSESGIKPREAPSLDLQKLVILRNENYSFRLVDLSDKDDLLFTWEGRKTIETNRSLIRTDRVENAFDRYLNRLPIMKDMSSRQWSD